MPIVSINGQTFEIKEGDTLFDALDAQGHTLPHGCLSGSCGACRINVLEGAENLQAASFIESGTVSDIAREYPDKENIRLSCRAQIKAGDVFIDTI